MNPNPLAYFLVLLTLARVSGVYQKHSRPSQTVQLGTEVPGELWDL